MGHARVLILGAPGTGKSTIGHALADRLRCPLVDHDDRFWVPGDPPYLQHRTADEVAVGLAKELAPDGDWVLNACLLEGLHAITSRLTLAVYAWMPSDQRMRNVVEREKRRFGGRVEPGGDMYDQSQAFLNWASEYEDRTVDHLHRGTHEDWLKTLPCPVLRLRADTEEDPVGRILGQLTG